MFSETSNKIGTIQRRLENPLPKDDTHKSRNELLFSLPCDLRKFSMEASSYKILLEHNLLDRE